MNNKFLNDTIVYGLGFVLLRGISFLLLPIYTNLLSTYDAGIIFIIYTILAFLNPVFSFGMDFNGSPLLTKLIHQRRKKKRFQPIRFNKINNRIILDKTHILYSKISSRIITDIIHILYSKINIPFNYLLSNLLS